MEQDKVGKLLTKKIYGQLGLIFIPQFSPLPHICMTMICLEFRNILYSYFTADF